MATQPLVSVCVPAYNNGEFLAETLKSVLRQTYPDFEIIVTDDCSTDNTVSVVKQFSDSRIQFFTNEANLGIGRNWNKALSLASGKYLKVLCGDDLIYPDCLQRQIRQLEDSANAGVVLAVCGSDVIGPSGKVVLRRSPRFPGGRVAGSRVVKSCVRWGTNLLGEPAVGLFRRETAQGRAWFDASNPYTLDLGFWGELLKTGDVYIDSERLAGFRISGTSVSAKVGLAQAAYFRSYARKLRAEQYYHLSRLDVLRAYIFSFQWCILRNLVINLNASKKGQLTAQTAC
jgi:glycosyltransferase involved in cell wall biosynthesis